MPCLLSTSSWAITFFWLIIEEISSNRMEGVWTPSTICRKMEILQRDCLARTVSMVDFIIKSMDKYLGVDISLNHVKIATFCLKGGQSNLFAIRKSMFSATSFPPSQ